MNVLVINSGSSSLKISVVDTDAEREVAAATVERIGEPGSAAPDHRGALRRLLAGIHDIDSIAAVGHRVVHGGARFSSPRRIDAGVLAALAELDSLAPLHNPANRRGIELCMELLPGRPQVAVFDTAFHQSLPPVAYQYAVPGSWREQGVRRYGFHGNSHRQIARDAARMLRRAPEQCNLISLHLGNGASVAAISGGRSIDTSMGMTPLEGLVMGSRAGDVDAGVLLFMLRAGLDADALEQQLNHGAGLRGLCGENDMRAVHALAAAGDGDAALAIEIFCYRVRKYIGAYCATLGRVDALAFTGGIGEHDAEVRARILQGLEWLGIRVDAARNRGCTGAAGPIHARGSRAAILVIPAREELEIARQVRELLRGG